MEPLRSNKPGSPVVWLVGCAGVALCFAGCVTPVLVYMGFVALLQVIDVAAEQIAGQVAAEVIEQALPPIIATMDFEGNLWVGDFVTAYEMTTEEFQTKWALEDFAALVEAYPELRSPWKETKGVEQTADSLTYTLTTEGDGGRPFIFRLVLRKQKEKWLVDEISMPGIK